MAVMAGSYAGFGSTSSASQASLSSQASYVPIFSIPYTMFDPNFGMSGSYASNANVNGTIITCQLCRKIGHGAKTCRILSSFGKGGYNGENGGFARKTGGNGNGNTITCQLCKLIGHGAKTCRILSYFGKGSYNGGNGGFAKNIGGNGNGNTITCQLCKQIGHGAKTCSNLSIFRQGNTLIGFTNQQRENLIGDASALLATGYNGSIPVKKSSYQSLVPAPILPYSTTAHFPPSVILSSTSAPNPETSSSAKLAKRQYDQVHNRFLNLTSENDAMQLVNQELNAKVMELQKIQESVMVQLSAECRIARERIEKLESEIEALVSKKMETEKLMSELELNIDILSESSRSSEHKIQYLLLKISALEIENEDNAEKLQAEICKKVEQIVGLLKEGETHEQHVDLMDKQVSQLHVTLEEKEQLIQQYKKREKNLEEQILENRTLLTAAETRIVEDEKKYDPMLESKQLELSRHLNDISQRNDQAISDIQKKYEVEKLEIVNIEKQKAEKLVGETKRENDLMLESKQLELPRHLNDISQRNDQAISDIQKKYEMEKLEIVNIEKQKAEKFVGETKRECKKNLEECSQGDLVVVLSLYVWVNLLLPLLSTKSGCNPQSRDLILQSEERILQFRDLKEIALVGSPRRKIMSQVAHKTLNYSIEAVKEDFPDLLRKQVPFLFGV